MIARLVVVLAAAVLVGGPNLEGTWDVVKSVHRNKETSGGTLAFTKDKVSVGAVEFSYVLDPTKNPKEIRFTGHAGAEKDKTTIGIYKFEGDLLVICKANKSGLPTPTEFESPPGSRNYVLTLKKRK